MTTKNTSNNIFSNLFHDNASQSSSDQSSTNKSNQSANPLTNTDSSMTTQHTATSVKVEDNDESSATKEVKTVDITISGATYPINCPVDEIEELEKAVLYINHFIREIRKDAPTLNHENLLVLCCLNMYEEMKQQKNTQASIRANDKQMRSLIEKITQDAKSIIS